MEVRAAAYISPSPDPACVSSGNFGYLSFRIFLSFNLLFWVCPMLLYTTGYSFSLFFFYCWLIKKRWWGMRSISKERYWKIEDMIERESPTFLLEYWVDGTESLGTEGLNSLNKWYSTYIRHDYGKLSVWEEGGGISSIPQLSVSFKAMAWPGPTHIHACDPKRNEG